MKSEWQAKALREIYDVRDGTHDSPQFHATGYPLITSKNLKPNGLSFDHVKLISERDYKKINERSVVHEGDILFAMIGTIGNPTLVTVEPNFAIKNVALFKVPKDQSNAFLKYYLESEFVTAKMLADAKGTTQKFVGLGYLRDFPIKVPPLAEQHRIVRILDEAFDSIEKAKLNTEKNLHNARALFECELHSIFESAWKSSELVSLSQLATHITDGDHLPPPKSPAGIPFITIGNIVKQSRTIDFSNTFRVKRDYFEKLKENRKPKSGDVLFTVTGSFGIPVIVDNGFEFCFQRHIALIRPNADTSSKWLYYLLLSPQVMKQAIERATGTAQKTVSLSVLRNFAVPKVPLSQQQCAVTKLNALTDQAQRLEFLYQRKLAALDTLEKSFLHQAFTGAL